MSNQAWIDELQKARKLAEELISQLVIARQKSQNKVEEMATRKFEDAIGSFLYNQSLLPNNEALEGLEFYIKRQTGEIKNDTILLDSYPRIYVSREAG